MDVTCGNRAKEISLHRDSLFSFIRSSGESILMSLASINGAVVKAVLKSLSIKATGGLLLLTVITLVINMPDIIADTIKKQKMRRFKPSDIL